MSRSPALARPVPSILLVAALAACSGDEAAAPAPESAPPAAPAAPVEAAPAREPVEPTVAERLRALERVRAGDAASALDALRLLRIQTGDPDGRDEIDDTLARWLMDDYQDAQRRSDRAAMRAVIDEVELSGLAGPRAGELRRRWASDRRQALEAAIDAGDVERADALAAETLADPAASFPERYADFEAGRWRAAFRTARLEEADAILERVALALAKGANVYAFQHTLAEEAPRARLERMAKDFARAGRPEAEWLCLEGARLAETPPGRGSLPATREDLIGLAMDLARIELAERIHAGEPAYAGIPREQAERICDPVYRNGDEILRDRRAGARDKDAALERALTCRRLIIASRIARARDQLDGGDASGAISTARNLVRDEPTWLHALYAHDPSYDPWPDVPDEVRSRIDAEHAGADRETRLRALRSELERYRYAHPFAELEPARTLLVDARAARGLERLERARVETGESSRQLRRDEGLDELRWVLREHPRSDAARRARSELRDAIRLAAESDDVSALCDLAGFHVAEAAPEGTLDEFRDELRGFIDSTTERLAEEQPFVDIFLTSLVADLFAGEPAGDAARAEVFDKGMAFVRSRMPTPEVEPAGGMPSGIPGLSSVAVDNGTRFHLLAFYEGPERFFVRLNPYRRATIVLTNGAYELAVLATGPDIRPYRATTAFGGEHREATYFIATEHPGQPQWNDTAGASASGRGRYQLARSPENSGQIEVDPRTGVPTRGS